MPRPPRRSRAATLAAPAGGVSRTDRDVSILPVRSIAIGPVARERDGMKLRMLVPALLIAAVTPLLMAPDNGACVRCSVVSVFHERLGRDAAWREVSLAAGKRYVIDSEVRRGAARVELYALEGELDGSCHSGGTWRTCDLTASSDAVVGILVDSTADESEVVVEVSAED
jgi:hypothetical protein